MYDVVSALRWLVFNFPLIEHPKDDYAKICSLIHIYCEDAAELIVSLRLENEKLKKQLQEVLEQ